MTITPDSLMTLEAYSKHRKAHKPQIIAHRRLRSVQLGEQIADPELLWHAYWGLGVSLRSLGDLEAAAPLLDKSLDIIERRQQELRTDEGKVSLLDSAQQAYDELIKVHLDAVASPEHDRAALAVAPEHKGATEYYGELMVERGNIAGARAMLARLDSLCTFGCAEADELRRWIEAGRSPAS